MDHSGIPLPTDGKTENLIPRIDEFLERGVTEKIERGEYDPSSPLNDEMKASALYNFLMRKMVGVVSSLLDEFIDITFHLENRGILHFKTRAEFPENCRVSGQGIFWKVDLNPREFPIYRSVVQPDLSLFYKLVMYYVEDILKNREKYTEWNCILPIQ